MADTEQNTPVNTEEPTQGTQETQEGTHEQADQGKGSKDALKADLAKERDRRQDTERQLREQQEQMQKILAVLGLNSDGTEDVDYEKQAKDLNAQLRTQQAENAVLRHGAGIADTNALLDSRAFNDSLSDLDFSDAEAVKAHISNYVEQNPRFSATPNPPTNQQGRRDATAGANNEGALRDPLQAFADKIFSN